MIDGQKEFTKIELLAPAGSFEQAIASIENGCNALYGGLKKWSARSRANNLSIDDYNRLMHICNEKGIKFYLTLNTLMKDAELEEIEELLDDDSFIRPDGVLVGDIGLYSLLSSKYPDISIHASTQFGAYSIEDVNYFRKLGIDRVVLARELTLEEIKNIKNHTDSEVEVFVYGNQCVVFSGNCLWGGLTRSGSGHKGCCIGCCNDIFSTEDGQLGDFFWVNNIGLYEEVDSLIDAGVDSIKIEGRVRPISEVRTVVDKFRRAISGEKIANDYGYKGFLGGNLPPFGMLNVFNPENPHKVISDTVFTKNDFFMVDNNGQPEFERGNGTQNGEYVFTVFSNAFQRNKVNIRVRFKMMNMGDINRVVSLEYVKATGEHIIFDFDDNDENNIKKFKLADLFTKVQNSINANVYECKSLIPSLSMVEIDERQLESFISVMNQDIKSVPVAAEFQFDEGTDKLRDIILCDNNDSICRYYEMGYRDFIYNIRTVAALKECINTLKDKKDLRVYYRIPYLDFEGKLSEIYPLLKKERVMITRIAQLDKCKEYGITKIIGDYMLNVWNSKSATWLKEKGVSSLIAHPEIPLDTIRTIQELSGMEMITIAAGKIPYGYTRSCFRRLDICGCKCDNSIVSFTDIFKGNNVELVCDNEFGFRSIFSDEIYISSTLMTDERKLFNVSGLHHEVADSILARNPEVYSNKFKIYCDGFEK